MIDEKVEKKEKRRETRFTSPPAAQATENPNLSMLCYSNDQILQRQICR